MRVPINPQTNVPTGQLGYERAADVSSGTKLLGEVVTQYGNHLAEEAKKREIFDVQKAIVDETNNLQQDFEAKKTAQPLGAPNFTQQVNSEYNTRHQKMLAEMKAQGFSDEALNEAATRLGSLRSSYVAQAIDFQDKSNFAKVHTDIRDMGESLGHYVNKNPDAVLSALDEVRVALTHSGLDAVEQNSVYEEQKAVIRTEGQNGYALLHPGVMLKLYGFPDKSTVNAPDGTSTTVQTEQIKPSGQLADNIVGGLQQRGLKDYEARGAAAGIFSESHNKIDALGPKVTRKSDGRTDQAYGLGQWIFERKDALFAKYGPHPTGSQQLDFLVAELRGGDFGGKAVLSQADDVAVLHSYIHNFMRPGPEGEQADLARGLPALGRRVVAHAEATAESLRPIPKDWHGNQEDAIRELGMTADQAATYLSTGKDTRTASPASTVMGYSVVSDPNKQDWAARADGSQKGTGFLGVLQRPDGGVSSEISVGVEIDGKETEIPLMVPGLDKSELDYLMKNNPAAANFQKNMPKSILAKAEANAKERIAQGLSPFKQADENVDTSKPYYSPEVAMDSTGRTGIPILDMSSSSDRMRMLTLAREVTNAQAADAKAARNAAHDAYLNSLYNDLQDGKKGQADLDQAYASGQITDYDERHKGQEIIDSKIKKHNDFDTYQSMLASGQKFNPYDDNAQKAADAGFENAVRYSHQHGDFANPFAIALRLWQRTGILAKQGAVMIRGGLISTDPHQVAGAASVASNMLKQNPNAFAGVEGGEEIAQKAANYAYYVDHNGMTAEQAVQKITEENSPEHKAKVKADEPQRNAFLSEIVGDKMHKGVDVQRVINDVVLGPTSVFRADAPRGSFNDTQKAEAKQTYSELALEHYDKYHDPAAAQAYAAKQLGRLYGVEGTRIVKYPATKAYPEIMGSRDYLYDQAKDLIKQIHHVDVKPEDIFLQPTASGSTAAAFRAGKAPPYEVHYVTHEDGHTVYHFIPGKVFVADLNLARQDAARKARIVEEHARETVVFPGIGPVGGN